MKKLKQLLKNQRGQGMVEYALILIVVIAIAVLIIGLGNGNPVYLAIVAAFQAVQDDINTNV